jgi:hypothetical protein
MSVKLSGSPTIFLWLLITNVGVISIPIHELNPYDWQPDARQDVLLLVVVVVVWVWGEAGKRRRLAPQHLN